MRRSLAMARERVTVRVPAKVNLFVAVRGVRADGYHELMTVLQTVSLYDLVTLRLAGPPGRSEHPAGRRRMTLELRCEAQGVPQDAGNLAVRAARSLGEASGVLATEEGPASSWAQEAAPRTVVTLEKAIPVGAGMGGGSADAAAALVGLNELWGCNLDDAALLNLAGDVGSDVPFCLAGGTALATGRGTNVARVLSRGRFHWVVGVDAEPLSTADVYRAWDDTCEPTAAEPDPVLAALVAGDAEQLGTALHNELEPAALALRPNLRERRDALLEAGALGAVVSGSGPTIVGLARDGAHASRLADAVAGRFAAVHVVSSPAGGPEPVQQ